METQVCNDTRHDCLEEKRKLHTYGRQQDAG